MKIKSSITVREFEIIMTDKELKKFYDTQIEFIEQGVYFNGRYAGALLGEVGLFRNVFSVDENYADSFIKELTTE